MRYFLQESPKMTISEARKLLGRKYNHMDDTQIQELSGEQLPMLYRGAL